MNEETLFEININDLGNPFEREKLESLPKDWLVELLVRHLKKEIKTIEYIKKYESIRAYYEYIDEDGYDEYNYNEDFKKELLEILGANK